MSLETFAADLAEYLEAHGIGARGTSLFVGQLPATTTNAVLLTEYSANGNASDKSRDVDFPMVQVMARASTWAAGRALIFDVHQLLAETGAVVAGTSRWTYCKPMQAPTPMGVDERGMWRFVCNYRFWLDR